MNNHVFKLNNDYIRNTSLQYIYIYKYKIIYIALNKLFSLQLVNLTKQLTIVDQY